MALLFILGVALLGLGAALTLRAATAPRLRISAQIRQIGTYGFGREAAGASPTSSRPLAAVADRIGRRCAQHVSFLKPLSSKQLLAAGWYELQAETLHGYRILGAVGFPTVILSLAIAGGSFSAITVIAVLVTGLMAWQLPASAVRTRGQRRLDRIDRDLPELLDVLIVTVEAGLGFGGSLQLVAGRFDGPLGEELRLTLQEQTMGLSTQAALQNMLERCDTPSVRSFVRAVLQGDSLGVSIGSLLRNVATETRKRRRALARERAQRAPLKLLFPLVLLIFPAMLIVLMYPAGAGIVHALGSG